MKGVEFEKEILEAEVSFIDDKVAQLQDKVNICADIYALVVIYFIIFSCLIICPYFYICKKETRLPSCFKIKYIALLFGLSNETGEG